MPDNTAAWMVKPMTKQFEVKSAPYTRPGEKEIVIRNRAIAINPIDWIKAQTETGKMVFPWTTYPTILGSDVAGEVVEVGKGVTRFKVGDRVLGQAIGKDKNYNDPAKCGFQHYTVLLAHMASPIPDDLPFEEASVFPLGLGTAACSLFQKDALALKSPIVSARIPTGKTLLVWGGSTSVGCNAIQLAVAAGYEVITTCSPRNFDLVKKLGASQAFDYNSRTVVPDLARAFQGKTTAGAISIGYGAADLCLDVLQRCKGGNKFLSMATYPTPKDPPERFVILVNVFTYFTGMFRLWLKSRTRGIGTKYVFGSSLIKDGVGKMIYEDFLPKALAEGTYKAAPKPLVVGKGLEYVQTGCDLLREGVSAKKVVVSL